MSAANLNAKHLPCNSPEASVLPRPPVSFLPQSKRGKHRPSAALAIDAAFDALTERLNRNCAVCCAPHTLSGISGIPLCSRCQRRSRRIQY